jgi:RNA polymerase sigma factor (sigma-70 family)
MGLALRENRSAPSLTEHELVAAVRTGDDAAFEELFSRYREQISTYVLRAVGDHARAEDITQEVFISALRRMRDTERPIAFKPWIYEIAKNACIDEFRRMRRTSEVPLNDDAESAAPDLQLPSPGPPLDVIVEERQTLRNLRGAFGGLSDTHHRILVMRELEGLSYLEIGERLGMSRAMVESTLFRARKRLNREFRELESGQRCEHVRSAIDRFDVRPARILGVRERRQVARHMAHCQPCRQYAWMAGFDASSLKRRRLPQKIAALLPIGWWRPRAHAAKHAVRMPSLAAARATPKLVRYSDTISQVGLGRAAAAAAALAVAVAGGGYVVAGSQPHNSMTATKAAVIRVGPALAPAAQPLVRSIHAGPVGGGGAGAARAGAGRGHHAGGAQAAQQQGEASGSGASAAGPASAPSTAAASSPGGHSAASAGSATGGRSPSGATSQTQRTGSGHGIIPTLIGGGGSSSTGAPVRNIVPNTSVPVQAPSVNAPAPVQSAVNTADQAANQGGNAAGQAVNAAGQVVNSTTQTVNSVGTKVPKLAGDAPSTLGG